MRFRPIVLACAALALAGIAFAPWVPSLRLAFSMVCHQQPDRCFEWSGGPVVVCARCLGVYAGLLAASAWPVRAPGAALWGLAAVNGLDWLLNAAPNGPRFALALVFTWLAAARLLASREHAASN
ncbi:MAG TPA: DUF2085 domain-containing protein [Bryobacteraceae bacterium]|nr:DUF2085 domain-containing protein [Bryobacteraceae bacterium]